MRALEAPEDPKVEIDTGRCEDFLLDTEAADLGAVGDLGEWTDTVPAPEEARYG